MKNAKRLFALLMASVMVMALAVNVSADENTIITVPNDGHTYEVYQIFTAELTEKEGAIVLTNIKWGKNGTGTLGAYVPKTDLDALAAKKDSTSNQEKLDVILRYVSLTNPIATLGGDAELEVNVDPGYYLIKDKDGSVTGDDAYTTYIVEVVDTVTISRKASVPEVVKKIIDGEDNPETPDVKENELTVNEAAIGEDVSYEIVGTLPSNVVDFKEYFYRFTDTLSKGLTYNDDAVVKVNGVDVTDFFYINAGTYNETTGTTITIAIQDLLALEKLTAPAVGNITKDTTVVITYTAKVNENAAIDTANPNKVILEYSNNPSDSGDGTPGTPPENPSEPTPNTPAGVTPPSEVETFVTEIHINKVDGNGKALAGAKFKITGESLKTVLIYTNTFTESENGEYWKLKDGTYTKEAPVLEDDPATQDKDEKTSDAYDSTTTKYTVTVNETKEKQAQTVGAEKVVGQDGKLTFSGLAEGTYTIVETKTPDGYNSIPDITLVVVFNAENKRFTYNWSGGAQGNTNTVTVINQPGSTLPETGGMGTTLIYAAGGILFAAAVVLLVTKKRMSEEE